MENKEVKLLTVKEYAKAVGVSEQAIYKRLRTEGNELLQFVVTVDNRKYIQSTALENTVPRKTPEAAESDTLREMIDFLKSELADQKQELQAEREQHGAAVEALRADYTAQLESKDNLLNELNNRVKELTEALQNTTNSLQAAQALHAGTLKQLTTGEETADTSETIEEQPEKKKSWFSRFFR